MSWVKKNSNALAIKYLFEMLIIIFSVSISFYIQELLNEKDRIELKNAGLIGVLSDFEQDLIIFDALSRSLDKRTKNMESILSNENISNEVFNELMSYFGFVGNDTNYKSMIATGSIEYVKNKRLFEELNRYYSWNYAVLKDQSKQDEMMFWKFADYIEKNHLIDSVGIKNKNSPYKKFYISIDNLEKIQQDKQIRNQLNTKIFFINLFQFFTVNSIKEINELKPLIETELNQ
ncbi:MAG: hypothetical protein ACON47_06695 [Flavobacteriaceae bacterium]